jgi:hypothetical protein
MISDKPISFRVDGPGALGAYPATTRVRRDAWRGLDERSIEFDR